MSYQLTPLRIDKLAEGVAAECFIKTGGDTVGIVKITTEGRFALWRNKKLMGIYSTMGMMCRALDRVEA